MINFDFNWNVQGPKVLFLGAHPDDIEIGCGGTIIDLLKHYNNAEIYWVVFSGNEIRKKEAIKSANAFLKDIEKKTVIQKSFKENHFPYNGEKIRQVFSTVKSKFNPDVIFTHYRNDFHQDHRIISELTLNTFRDNIILEYEIPKYDGDLSKPQIFSPINKNILKSKVSLIIKYFQSQNDKFWFTEETFKSIARIRGIESKSKSGYAEAFYCRKIIWDFFSD